MTRRDFELIALVIANTVGAHRTYNDADRRAYGIGACRDVAADFAFRLASVNPRFDRARFMAACGFKGE